ncbi:MAG: OmpA family protein [Pseudomonadota bacterium]
MISNDKIRPDLRRPVLAAATLMALVLPETSLSLTLPQGATEMAAVDDAPSRYGVAIGPATPSAPNATVPKLFLDGQRQRNVWQIPAEAETALGVFQQIEAQLQSDGWEMLFDCASQECGGFDFRFALPVVSMPAMFVDIADFRYLSARRPAAATEGADVTPEAAISVLVSPAADLIHVQITTITRTARPGPVSDAPTASSAPSLQAPPQTATDENALPDLATALRQSGSVTLNGVRFEPGSTQLSEGDYPMLDQAAALLAAAPDLRVAVVGHTDTTGSLDANLAVSEARAQTVADRLAAMPGVDPAQISAHGVGFLAPRGPNTTDAERAANRRVNLIWVAGDVRDLPVQDAP